MFMESADQFLKRRLPDLDPEAIQLSDLVAEASEIGIKPFQLNAKLFPLCSSEDVQKSWSQWKEISEREEIRLRLMALNTHESIHESLIPFLIFYFRSSDSILYQTTAQIIGKQLPHHEELKQFLFDYLKERNVDPSGPINLNGIRSRRRILIALTSYCAKHGLGTSIFKNTDPADSINIALPIATHQLQNQLPVSHLDLSALMLSLSILLNSDKSEEYMPYGILCLGQDSPCLWVYFLACLARRCNAETKIADN